MKLELGTEGSRETDKESKTAAVRCTKFADYILELQNLGGK